MNTYDVIGKIAGYGEMRDEYGYKKKIDPEQEVIYQILYHIKLAKIKKFLTHTMSWVVLAYIYAILASFLILTILKP